MNGKATKHEPLKLSKEEKKMAASWESGTAARMKEIRLPERIAGLGFLAGGFLDVGESTKALRVAAIFLASLCDAGLRKSETIQRAASVCVEALFRPGFFQKEHEKELAASLAESA
jgi:hypothetical protein